MSEIKVINDRCPLQSECGQKKCEFKFRERDCTYYQGNARPGAEIEDQRQAMEAEWEARMSTPSVLTSTEDIQCITSSEILMLPASMLFPHPDNPRKNVGDVTELAESIKANGILQNLTVVPRLDGDTKWDGEAYTVIIGHRRLAAAKKAGLTELPCIVREMSPQEQVKTMLMENMQRTDLTLYEQAQGFQMMLDMGETVESIAKDCGFSQTTVRRRVRLLDLDADKFKKSEARGATLQDYLELDKIENPELKNKALDAIGTANFREVLKKAIEEEKHKRRMAQWETDLEAFALKIERRDYVGETHVSMDYVANYGSWSPKDKMVERPADAGEVKYYYCVGTNEISLYKDRQEHIETEEERQRKERQRIADRIKAELKEITERHFSLRSEFISDFSASKKCLVEICKYAASVLVGDSEWGRAEINAELAGELLDLDIDDNTDYPTFKAMVEQKTDEAPEYALLVCAYASVDEDENGYWEWKWNSETGTYEYKYAQNVELDRLYDFLIALGYEMSDEEKAMRDGTHQLLNREDV